MIFMSIRFYVIVLHVSALRRQLSASQCQKYKSIMWSLKSLTENVHFC